MHPSVKGRAYTSKTRLPHTDERVFIDIDVERKETNKCRMFIFLGCVRTAVGTFGGTLKDVGAVTLGSVVLGEACKRAGVDARLVDYVLMGNVLQAGLGQNPARQAALIAGIPKETPAMTIKRYADRGLTR